MKIYRIKNVNNGLYLRKTLTSIGFYSDSYVRVSLTMPDNNNLLPSLEDVLCSKSNVPQCKARVWLSEKSIIAFHKKASKDRLYNLIVEDWGGLPEEELKQRINKGMPKCLGLEYLHEEDSQFSNFKVEVDDNGVTYTVGFNEFNNKL